MKTIISLLIGILFSQIAFAVGNNGEKKDIGFQLNIVSSFDFNYGPKGSFNADNQNILAQLFLFSSDGVKRDSYLPITNGYEDVRLTASIPVLKIVDKNSISFGGVTVPSIIITGKQGQVVQINVDHKSSGDQLAVLLRPQIQQAINHTGLIANLPSDRMPKVISVSQFFCLQRGQVLNCSMRIGLEGNVTQLRGKFLE